MESFFFLFLIYLVLNSSYLFGTHVLRIRYPSGHSVEVSRIVGALQEDQSQDVLSGDMAAFHILIPIQKFVLEKT